MRSGTVQEYNEVTATPHVTKRHFPGKRVSSVEWKLMGTVVAEKTTTTTRGKTTDVHYQINPDFLGK